MQLFSDISAQIRHILELIKNITIPVGEITMYGGATAPTGWLNCDGTAVSRTTYADLFAVIGETFGQGDNSTTFNLPDFKDAFPKGTGTSTIFTENTKGTRSASYTGGNASGIGSKQDDGLQGHWHYVENSSGQILDDSVQVAAGGANGWSFNANSVTPLRAGGILSDGSNGTPRTGKETVGKNIEVNFIIKF